MSNLGLSQTLSLFNDGTSGKESTCQCRRHKRCGFDARVGKIPWRRKWQPTPGFSPGKSHGQRSLAGYSPRGHKESSMTEHSTARSQIQFTGDFPGGLEVDSVLPLQGAQVWYFWGELRFWERHSVAKKIVKKNVQFT